jgi:hypothetical protein
VCVHAAFPLPCLPRLGDQLVSVNGISLMDVAHANAVQVLKDSGKNVSLVSTSTSTVTAKVSFAITQLCFLRVHTLCCAHQLPGVSLVLVDPPPPRRTNATLVEWSMSLIEVIEH